MVEHVELVVADRFDALREPDHAGASFPVCDARKFDGEFHGQFLSLDGETDMLYKLRRADRRTSGATGRYWKGRSRLVSCGTAGGRCSSVGAPAGAPTPDYGADALLGAAESVCGRLTYSAAP